MKSKLKVYIISFGDKKLCTYREGIKKATTMMQKDKKFNDGIVDEEMVRGRFFRQAEVLGFLRWG